MRQSGAIPYRRTEAGLEVLLITSTSTGQWQFPKGMLEPDLTPAASAAEEVREEAGATGMITSDHPITDYVYRKDWGGPRTVDLYPLHVERFLPVEEWEEYGHRERRWATIPGARALLTNPDLHRCLDDFLTWLGADYGQR